MTRKLASIQTITKLTPIKGADKIESAQVLGWNIIVKKGEFKVGDTCVFFEIDSVLPEREWSEFMRPRKFRVRSCKMRKVLSQGLALPLNILVGEYQVGDDVTAELNVSKFEPKFSTNDGETIGGFPGFISKTDETRLQSVPECLTELRGKPYYITVKYDGQSGTFIKHNGEFMVCSRVRQLKEGNSNWWVVAKALDLANKIPEGYAVQGEVCGPGIQKNRLGLSGLKLFAFNVFNIKAGQYLNFGKFNAFCTEHDIEPVKLEEIGSKFNYTLDELLVKADGFYDSKQRREGIVIRPAFEMHSETLGGRLSFKVISNKFLLKDK